MQKLVFTRDEVLEAARELAASRYADAMIVIASGSIVEGHGTAGSDLDLTLIYETLPHAYRESMVLNGLPVEAFCHDIETIQWFVDDSGKDNGTMAHMIATGVAVVDTHNLFPRLSGYAQKVLSEITATTETLDALRYSISNLIDDLNGDRPVTEKRAVLYEIYGKMGTLALQTTGHRAALNKRLARSLAEHAPDVLRDLDQVMEDAHTGVVTPVHIEKLLAILDRCGGYLFDGYKRDANPAWRSKPAWRQGM